MKQLGFLTFDDPDDYQRLQEAFEKVNYTGTVDYKKDVGVLETLGVKDFPSMKGTDVPLLLRRTNARTPLNTLIRLFLIEVPCDAEDVRHAVQPVELDTLIEAGIVRIDGASVTAAVKLMPYKNFIVAFDLPGVLQTGLRKNYVMGIGSSTLTLANLTIRNHSRLTLDLGTGCGIHAFLAAGHSDYVAATDLNPRALQFAKFNTRLNGLSNIDCLEGDLFEPVKDKKFDLIITNPPFVISPENQYIYRDSGMEADQIIQKIVSEVPQFLNEGGFCQILCNWTENPGQSWGDRLHGWFDGTGCDVWVFRTETVDAETYASTWIRHTERFETELFPKHFEEWMEYYDKKGISAMGSGLITMRRSSGRKNWFQAGDAPEMMLGPCGEHVVRLFKLQDFLQSAQDNAVSLNTPFRISDDVCLDRQARPSVDGWVDELVLLRLTKGLAYAGKVDHHMVNMLIQCDGRRKLGDIMNEIAVSLKSDPASIKYSFCNIVRDLVSRGFLLPPDL